MNRTYAPNAIIFGVLAGIVVALKVNTVLGIVAGIAVTVVGWIAIRFIEKLIGKGVDAAGSAISKAINKNKESDQ